MWSRTSLYLTAAAYGYNCKHAVAVILQYAEQVKNKIPLEIAKDSDERIILLNYRAKTTGMPNRVFSIATQNVRTAYPSFMKELIMDPTYSTFIPI